MTEVRRYPHDGPRHGATPPCGTAAPPVDSTAGGQADPDRPSGLAVWAAGLVVAGLPTLAWAAVPAEGPHTGPILFGLALLVVVAKLGGLVAERLGQPPVLGELLIGIGLANLLPPLLGGSGVAYVRSEPTLLVLAEIGVLILLFDVGLEADLRALFRVGWSSLAVALIGIAAPLLVGWGAAAWLMPEDPSLAHVFVGATLTATSIGITARVLKDLGVTRRREAQIILGAAVIDDVLGLALLAIVSGAVAAVSSGGHGLDPWTIAGILLKAGLFLGITIGVGHRFSGRIVRLAARTGQPGMLLVFGLALCFTLAWLAEQMGLADIIGAFAAGLLLDPYGEGIRTHEEEATLSELMRPLSAVFVPLFFVLMGIKVSLESLAQPQTLGLGAALILCALAGKLAAGFGAWGRGVNRLVIGIGMIPRGEVGLIFAGIGTRLVLDGKPVLAQGAFSAVVLMVVVTTLLAPPGLRWAFRTHAGGAGR